ncbi:recombinase family protein [Brevibacterium casei]|uniref:recombinase family protein n=1 Tax=Brevibacterium casei TaxID=33889 RepID=UPI00186B6F97|nr:recombinase family protein [Brevibacterium casei]MBE4694843.1 recombinase family protein [Brevibacterium casei]MBY3577965.1 recombinase family protein [Brevibacterium casei]MCT2356956.1 recombinase family protein [Brevibacterium casei]
MTIIDADRTAIDSLVAPTPFPGSFAVSYLRVSTKEQAEKGGQAEGFSIPAQREANQRKADQLGATIIEEFVDAGESARKADRPELMRMIQYVAKHKTNYCIVHKVDRLARNRADDVTIHLALKDAGVTLVSATENIDETPSGMLLHGIMSSIAEFYSRNLATEVVKGLSQKAAQGGTVTKAPIGYRNVGVRDEFGREVRTVEIDEERAPLVRWAFQVFASGDWTTSQLHQELVARGLTTAASPRRPSRPIGKSSVHRMLTNPYYKGSVRYQGVTYVGVHEAIVPNEVWDQVQTVLGTHRSAADATQVHEHYLKGTVFCGQCGSRLLVCNAKSSQGTIYPYFVCASRHGGRGDCARQAMLIEQVERLIERFYTKVQIDPETIEAVSAMIHARFDEMMAEGAAELADLASRRTQLEGEQQKLLQAHYAGAIPLDLLKREQDRITASLETIEHRITAHHGHYAAARENLDDSLKLLSNAADIYEHADDANRRLINQALFKAIYIDEDNDVRVGYRNPYDGLSRSGLHADALSWAAEAKKMGQARTATKGGPLVASSHLTRLG